MFTLMQMSVMFCSGTVLRSVLFYSLVLCKWSMMFIADVNVRCLPCCVIETVPSSARWDVDVNVDARCLACSVQELCLRSVY